MAAVRSLRVSVKSDSGSDRSESESESDSDRDAREAEPMEVEEGELEPEDVPVNRSLKELLPDTSRRYENKAGAFITGIDVNSKEAIERKEKRARRFHFRPEETVEQRTVFLDKDTMKKAIPRLRMEAIYVTGVDDMSTQDVFGYFKEYPPAHIEWIDDTSCNVVWLDDNTSIRALVNGSRLPDPEAVTTETESGSKPPGEQSKERRGQSSDEEEEEEEEEGEVDEEEAKTKSGEEIQVKDGEEQKAKEDDGVQVDDLSLAERESLLRNELRPAIKPFKGNKLFLRFATHDDKKELGAARRSRYYMKYGNPNYGETCTADWAWPVRTAEPSSPARPKTGSRVCGADSAPPRTPPPPPPGVMTAAPAAAAVRPASSPPRGGTAAAVVREEPAARGEGTARRSRRRRWRRRTTPRCRRCGAP